jgi:GTP-binding protein
VNKPLVALVGRPNVGKSALFNRIVGRRLAVVHETPGTTRDRLQATAEWGGRAFTLVDTGGIEVLAGPRQGPKAPPPPGESEPFLTEIRAQAEIAIAEADVIVLVVDVTTGLTGADEQVAELLRRPLRGSSDRKRPLRGPGGRAPLIVAANKADTVKADQGAYEFYGLGLGEVIPISAVHGTGTGDLLDAIVAALPPAAAEEEEEDVVRIAIVGRPNTGKSSLLNRLAGSERAIVSPVPGTTRDAIDTRVTVGDQAVLLIDTAGIRRRGKVGQGLEQYSVLRALKAINRADVALLLIDAAEGVAAQDAHIAGFVLDEAKSVIVIVNKWDLMKRSSPDAPAPTLAEYGKQVREALRFLDFVPVLFISAKTGYGVEHVLPAALSVAESRMQRIPTGELNRVIRAAVDRHPPATHKGRTLRIYYATQAAVDPPTFLLFVNDPTLLHFSYERYIENVLRENYSFSGTPLRISTRRRKREME